MSLIRLANITRRYEMGSETIHALRDVSLSLGEGRALDCNYIMSNNFAFGGINTSLIFKRWPA